MQHPPEPKLEQLWQRQHWPTWALMVGVYGAWIALMNYASLLSWWLVSPLCALLLCLHGSIQHELIHGHPSPWKRLNDALGWPPLSMWIPYFQYRDHHRLHHQTSVLTQLGLDPESYYHWPSNWLCVPAFLPEPSSHFIGSTSCSAILTCHFNSCLKSGRGNKFVKVVSYTE